MSRGSLRISHAADVHAGQGHGRNARDRERVVVPEDLAGHGAPSDRQRLLERGVFDLRP
jgi:hypothetical protein